MSKTTLSLTTFGFLWAMAFAWLQACSNSNVQPDPMAPPVTATPPPPAFQGTFELLNTGGNSFSLQQVTPDGGYNGVVFVNGQLHARLVGVATPDGMLTGNFWLPDATYAPFYVSADMFSIPGIFNLKFQKSSDEYSNQITPIPPQWIELAAQADAARANGNGKYHPDTERMYERMQSNFPLMSSY